MHTQTPARHPSEDDLVLFHYGEIGDREAIDVHLASCEACRSGYEALQRALANFESLTVPEPDERFEARMWRQIQPRLDARPRFGWRAFFSPARLAVAGAMAVLVIAAFVAGRNWPRPEPTAPVTSAASDVSDDRVLLVAVIDHLDRSERALTELVNAEPARSVDISTEQASVRELVPVNRLIRQTATEVGEAGMASLLDDLERVLVEIAHSPSTVSPQEFNEIRKRIESQGIIFKVRVLGSDVRERQAEAARSLVGRQRS
jgi:acetolactate synthase small subunit